MPEFLTFREVLVKSFRNPELTILHTNVTFNLSNLPTTMSPGGIVCRLLSVDILNQYDDWYAEYGNVRINPTTKMNNELFQQLLNENSEDISTLLKCTDLIKLSLLVMQQENQIIVE